MEIFYSDSVSVSSLSLTPEDSIHCVRVLRHREGDVISVIDGLGTMYECRITVADSRCVAAEILNANPDWHSHPYNLTMAVCPTKNNDRFEWFVEKATETGVDRICPVIGERSERRVFKSERSRKIALSAAKQSLKSLVPVVDEPCTVKEFLTKDRAGVKLIACCFENDSVPRVPISRALRLPGDSPSAEITVLIGPEGDFSTQEVALALENGYVPIHLGQSRLRTETAAVVAAVQVYTLFY